MSRRTRLALAISILAVMLIPVVAVASDKFTDVPDSNIFHDDIAWMADNGVTAGCNPPANDQYCPSATVTREQMAAFMRRLAVNQVVDADKLDGLDSTAFASASTVPGLAATSKTVHDLTSVESVMGSVQLAYPAAGVVLVTVEGYQSCPTGTVWQRILADNLPGASFYMSGDADGSFMGFSNQYTWVVAGPGTTTFSSSGYSTGGACSGGGLGSIVAMYLPTTYGSVAAVELQEGATGQPQP